MDRNNLLVKGQFYTGFLLVFSYMRNFGEASLVSIDQSEKRVCIFLKKESKADNITEINDIQFAVRTALKVVQHNFV